MSDLVFFINVFKDILFFKKFDKYYFVFFNIFRKFVIDFRELFIYN